MIGPMYLRLVTWTAFVVAFGKGKGEDDEDQHGRPRRRIAQIGKGAARSDHAPTVGRDSPSPRREVRGRCVGAQGQHRASRPRRGRCGGIDDARGEAGPWFSNFGT